MIVTVAIGLVDMATVQPGVLAVDIEMPVRARHLHAEQGEAGNEQDPNGKLSHSRNIKV